MATQTNSVWYIGDNKYNECGVEGRATCLELCKWSKRLSNVIKISRGYYFSIFTISSYKDEFAVFGFIRNFQQLLPYQTKTFYIIPSSITLICLNYFGNNYNEYYSAGNDRYGQLGRTINPSNDHESKLIQPIPELNNKTISKICIGSGGQSVFWIGNDDKLYIHGSNHHQQLGSNIIQNNVSPIIAENIPNDDPELIVVEAASNEEMSIVTCNDGSVWSSGYSHWYAHGHFDERLVKKYRKIDFDIKIKKVSIGSGTTVFLAENGQVWGCGYNSAGSLGLGHTHNDITSIIKISWFDDNGIFIIDLEMGQYHGIALDDKGMVYCWGNNSYGQCGIDININEAVTPNKVKGELKYAEVVGIRAGGYHSGCVTKDGNYYLWGWNTENECCNEDYNINQVYIPNKVNKYVFEKSKCKQILDMVLGMFITMFLLNNC